MKVWLIPVLLVMALGQACNKRTVPPPAAFKTLPHVEPQPESPIVSPSQPVSLPVATSADVSIPAPEPPPPPVEPALAVIDDAERAFKTADYALAIRRYDEYLKLAPAGERRDEALFQLGLIYALPAHPQRDWTRALAHFKELTTHYPTSRYHPLAQMLTALRTEVMQLSGEREKLNERIKQLERDLDRQKQIDAERLKPRVP